MTQGAPHIVLAGGGTAGHVNPLLAVAGAIRELEPAAQVTVIGTAVGLEKDLVPQAGYELDTIEKVPFPPQCVFAAIPGQVEARNGQSAHHFGEQACRRGRWLWRLCIGPRVCHGA